MLSARDAAGILECTVVDVVRQVHRMFTCMTVAARQARECWPINEGCDRQTGVVAAVCAPADLPLWALAYTSNPHHASAISTTARAVFAHHRMAVDDKRHMI